MKKSLFYCFSLASLSCSSFLLSENTSHATDDKSTTDYRMITPNATAIISDTMTFDVSADFIYWTPGQSNMSIVVVDNDGDDRKSGPPQTSNQSLPQYQLISAQTKYSPGFKIGFGMGFDHDGWDLALEYTWYHTRSKHAFYREDSPSIVFKNQQLFFETAPFIIATNPFFNASIPQRTFTPDWRYHFNNFDLELGRNFFVSHYLTLRPHVGLKGGWQKQSWNNYWTFTNSSSNSNFFNPKLPWTNANYLIHINQKTWDVGLRAGLDTNWFMTKNWAIVGNLAFANVWTHLTQTRTDTASTSGAAAAVDNASNFETLNIRGKMHDLNNVTEIKLGFLYDTWFVDETYRLRLEALWETQLWDTFPTFFTTQDDVVSFQQTKTPNLQGLTIKAQLDF